MQPRADELNILVVEDDEALRDLICTALGKEGHRVMAVDSAEAGLELLPNWTFQVALLDHQLPQMEGMRLAEYLKRSNPEMYVVLMTGCDDRQLARRTRSASVRFLEKPFLIGDLITIVSDYLGEAAEREAERLRTSGADYDPPLCHYARELGQRYAMAGVPSRIEDRLAQTVKRALNNLEHSARYTERERVMAFAGLVTAQVLGIGLPRAKSGRTLFEEYDRLMLERGRKTAFGEPEPRS